MRVGHSVRDITPEPGLTLSGFASRCERPSTGVDDPIFVHALAVEGGGRPLLLLVYDLLALGPDLASEIHAAVGDRFPGWDVTLACTHTHSAPATIKLIGCGRPDRAYWDRIGEESVEAVAGALNSLRPASMRHVALPVRNVSYNRRSVLEDGRVVMSRHPAAPLVKTGPTWDRLLLVRFDGDDGNGIAGIVHWAAHPCVVATSNISADFPGELRLRLGRSTGVPFLYLQGACGDLNLPFQKMNRAEMLENVDALMAALPRIEWSAARLAVKPDARAYHARLPYAPVLARPELEVFVDGMEQLARSGCGPDPVTSVLANILNVEPGGTPDPVMVRYIAGALGQWGRELLARYGNLPRSCNVPLKVWKLGPLILCFIAAEVFAETAIRLQEAFPELLVTTVGYASPLAGYLPTDEALREGGYEVEYAYRFYGHPAPFAAGAEPAVVDALRSAIASVAG